MAESWTNRKIRDVLGIETRAAFTSQLNFKVIFSSAVQKVLLHRSLNMFARFTKSWVNELMLFIKISLASKLIASHFFFSILKFISIKLYKTIFHSFFKGRDWSIKFKRNKRNYGYWVGLKIAILNMIPKTLWLKI